MKIGIVGTFVRDHIFPWHGEETYSIGGLYFTTSYVANLLGANDEVVPVCFAGDDFYEEIITELSRYSNVNCTGIKRLAKTNTAVKLIYNGPQTRDEITTEPMPAIRFEQLEDLKDADAVIVNLITGVDVDLASLQEFKKSSNATIYLDFHSRALGINPEGKRFYNRPADWQEWLQPVDILQINEMEAKTLARFEGNITTEALAGFGEGVVSSGPSICHITLAEKGSVLIYKSNDQIRLERFQAVAVDDVVDIIGCGDAFEAAFVVSYLSDADVTKATEFAHKVAAANCTFIGSTGINTIKDLIE